MAAGTEATALNGKEHICVCSSQGGPGVGMGKGWKGRVQEGLEGRVQTEHILGPSLNQREAKKKLYRKRERTA